MGVIIALMGMISIFLLVCFFTFQPKFAKPEQLRVFNWSVIGMTAMVEGAWLLNAHLLFAAEAFDKYKSFVTWAGFFAILSLSLFIFFIARNFWIFKGGTYWGRR